MLTEQKLDINKHISIVGNFTCTEQIMEEYIKTNAFKKSVYKKVDIYLVFDKDVFIGYYGIKNRTIEVDDIEGNSRIIKCVELECIAVDVEYIRQGIGTEMFFSLILPKCVKKCRETRDRLLVLFTLSKESTAFYKSLGFVMAMKSRDITKYVIRPNDFTEGLEPMIYELPTREELKEFLINNHIVAN